MRTFTSQSFAHLILLSQLHISRFIFKSKFLFIYTNISIDIEITKVFEIFRNDLKNVMPVHRQVTLFVGYFHSGP